MPIEISLKEGSEVIARKSDCEPYSIAQLSDGERNVLLIAATVLTVKPGTLILIDEPERHLHRSIISPLLTNLFAKRQDCAFVISTHDVMLPLDNPSAQSLLLRGCTYTGNLVTAWDADIVPAETEIDETLKKDILGARRKILFVEGTEKSLDKQLYSLIFPGISVISKATCRDVEHAVVGVRDASSLHWLHAFGIVDNDGRAPADIKNLEARGVYAISVFSVESIFYYPEIQRLVVQRHAEVTGEDAAARLESAKAAAIEAIKPHIQRLSNRMAEKAVREEIFRQWPRDTDIAAAKPISISVDVAAFAAKEHDRLRTAADADELSTIIARYPIRETPALTEIARKLGFQDCGQYEGAVRKLLMDDDNALKLVRSLFGSLPAEIKAA